MQATSKEIYETVSAEHNIAADVVKFVGDAFFKEWDCHLKNPKTIILKIKKLGRMYMRKNKMLAYKEKTEKYFSSEKFPKAPEDYNKMRQKELSLYELRLADYEEYVAKKKAIQAIRYPHQPLLTPQDDPDTED